MHHGLRVPLPHRMQLLSRLVFVEFAKKSLKMPKGGNQNSHIEEQTTQWPKEQVQKGKQRSTKHTYIKLKIE
jgi:hypothetical protein